MLPILKYSFRFVFFVLLQVFVLNHIGFLGYINPYLYVFFIISLPVNMPRMLVLLLAFLMGFCIDIFSCTLGVHIFATVLAAFLRSYLLQMGESNTRFGYILSLVTVHHFCLFLLESFEVLSWFLYVKTICSIVFTMLLIGGIYLLTPKTGEFKKSGK